MNLVASSKLTVDDVEIYSYLKATDYLSKFYNLNREKIAVLGYSYGAALTKFLGPALDAKYTVHVATFARNPVDFVVNENTKQKYIYIFNRQDAVVPIDRTLEDIESAKALTDRLNIQFKYSVSIVNGAHAFGEESSKIAVNFLLDNMVDIENGYHDHPTAFDFNPTQNVLIDMSKFDFHYNYRIAAQSSIRQYSPAYLQLNREEYISMLSEMFKLKIKEDELKKTDKIQIKNSYLVNSKTFQQNKEGYAYKSWIFNFLENMNIMVIELAPITSEKNEEIDTVLILNRDNFFQQRDLIENYIKNKWRILLFEGFGYGHICGSQLPLGASAASLGKKCNACWNECINSINVERTIW